MLSCRNVCFIVGPVNIVGRRQALLVWPVSLEGLLFAHEPSSPRDEHRSLVIAHAKNETEFGVATLIAHHPLSSFQGGFMSLHQGALISRSSSAARQAKPS